VTTVAASIERMIYHSRRPRREENLAAQRFSLETIEDFLAQKRNAWSESQSNLAALASCSRTNSSRCGYNIVPVNPTPPRRRAGTASRLQNIRPLADAALLMTSPAITDTVVCDCAATGILRVWM
jgi:hypothetical protein